MKFFPSSTILCFLLISTCLAESDQCVSVSDLNELKGKIKEADVIVVKSGASENSPELYRSTERNDIEAFADSLALECPEERFFCMCAGTQTVLLSKEGTLILKITNHHNESISADLLGSNVKIADKDRWFSWFDHRGIVEPRKEYIRDLEQQIQLHGGEGKRQTINEYFEEERKRKLYDDLFSILTLVKFIILVQVITLLILISKRKLRVLLSISLFLFVILGMIRSVLIYYHALDGWDPIIRLSGACLKSLFLIGTLGVLLSIRKAKNPMGTGNRETHELESTGKQIE